MCLNISRSARTGAGERGLLFDESWGGGGPLQWGWWGAGPGPFIGTPCGQNDRQTDTTENITFPLVGGNKPKFFSFCLPSEIPAVFRGKHWPNNTLAPPSFEWTPPPGNPRSATGICLTSLARAKCGVRSTLCWKIPNISGSIELIAL